MPNWVRLLARFAVSVGPVALATWLLWRVIGPYAFIALLILSPVIGIALAKPLIELSHEGLSWLAAQPLERWEGNYYEFASAQIRIFEYRGELWFVAADVIKSTGIVANADSLLAVYSNGCETLERQTCLTMPTLEKFLLANPGPESGRFLLWARREVIDPWEKKVGV
jgi:hypothetical protein